MSCKSSLTVLCIYVHASMFPFSLFVLVSGEEVDVPVSVKLTVGATYDAGVISFVAVAVPPTVSVTIYL